MPKKIVKKVRRAPKAKAIMKMPRQPVHTFTRLCSSNQGTANALPILLSTDISGRPQFTTLTTSGTNLALAFRLDQVDLYLNGSLSSTFSLPNYTEFTNLFDEYCIKKIDVFVMPSYTNAGIGSAIISWAPWIVHAADYDDTASTPSTTLMQYEGAKFTQLVGSIGHQNAQILRTVYPRAPSAVIKSTGVTTGQSPTPNMWINCSNPNVQHFGFKMSLDDSYQGSNANTTICGLNIACRYHVAFRDIV